MSVTLRIGRVTKYLPRARGLNALRAVYRVVIPPGKVFRVSDFDGDLKFDVDLREGIGVNLWHNPQGYERRERDLFCAAIREGCNVLDVGANIGIYTLLAAKRGANVFAIEADPVNAATLRHHLALNKLSERVKVIEMAASEGAGTVELHRNSANSGASSFYGDGERFVVKTDSIDSLQLPPIDVCKMDIEGAEILALRGMHRTFANSPNLQLLVECSNEHRDTAELLEILHQHFRKLSVVGAVDDASSGIPPFCNLWCTR
jgi:FkbM family methyltransferase